MSPSRLPPGVKTRKVHIKTPKRNYITGYDVDHEGVYVGRVTQRGLREWSALPARSNPTVERPFVDKRPTQLSQPFRKLEDAIVAMLAVGPQELWGETSIRKTRGAK